MTHLSSPLDSLPDTEVAHDPDQQQGEGQLPAYSARVVNTLGDLQGSSSVARNQTRVNTIGAIIDAIWLLL